MSNTLGPPELPRLDMWRRMQGVLYVNVSSELTACTLMCLRANCLRCRVKKSAFPNSRHCSVDSEVE